MIFQGNVYKHFDKIALFVFQVSFDGHLPKIQPPRTPTPKAPQWKIKVAPYQSHPEDQRRLNVEEGEVRSFLTNKFPECRPTKIIPKSKQAKEANLEQQ